MNLRPFKLLYDKSNASTFARYWLYSPMQLSCLFSVLILNTALIEFTSLKLPFYLFKYHILWNLKNKSSINKVIKLLNSNQILYLEKTCWAQVDCEIVTGLTKTDPLPVPTITLNKFIKKLIKNIFFRHDNLVTSLLSLS